MLLLGTQPVLWVKGTHRHSLLAFPHPQLAHIIHPTHPTPSTPPTPPLLPTPPSLRELDDTQRFALSGMLVPVDLTPGMELCLHGDPADKVWLLHEGEVQVGAVWVDG